MTKFIMVLFVVLFAFTAQAGEQDHTCQGGHNCNEGGGPIEVSVGDTTSSSTVNAAIVNNVTVESPANEGGGFGITTIDDADVNVNVEGDEAVDLSEGVGTPATIFTDACGSGVAGGFSGGSASLGEGNEVCLWLAISRAASEQGNTALATSALNKAAVELDDQNDTIWKRWSQTPYVGWLAPRRWLPFFGKNF
jgi:hypothetical protein